MNAKDHAYISKVSPRWSVRGMLSAVGICSALFADAALAADSSASMMRRITPDQYRHIIEDVFGSTVDIGGRFSPEVREGGLLAVGAGRRSVASGELEQFHAMARTIANQVVDDSRRQSRIPCVPKAANKPDDACSLKFLSAAGKYLYRRPLTQAEMESFVSTARTSAESLNDFYQGLSASLAGMLISPDFLFRKAIGTVDSKGESTMDDYSRASQISFFLWNTAPDDALLAAAEQGKLRTNQGLEREIDRMMSSPRVDEGVRAFFSDMLGFDAFAGLSKDAVIYPKFRAAVIADAQEQTLRTIVDVVKDPNGDYRDIFTTPKTHLTPALGSIYRVPVSRGVPNGQPDAWSAYEYSADDPRAGILSHISFVSLHSHPGRTSATVRGKALREQILCQKVPDPPGNVDFTLVESEHSEFKTARERVTAHLENPVCAGCHKITDPMGLAMENFDSDGSFRITENGTQIDASGQLDGAKFDSMAGLSKAVREHPATVSCVVNRAASYATGRAIGPADKQWNESLKAAFIADKHNFLHLMRRIALSDEFYRLPIKSRSTGRDGASSNTTGQ